MQSPIGLPLNAISRLIFCLWVSCVFFLFYFIFSNFTHRMSSVVLLSFYNVAVLINSALGANTMNVNICYR